MANNLYRNVILWLYALYFVLFQEEMEGLWALRSSILRECKLFKVETSNTPIGAEIYGNLATKSQRRIQTRAFARLQANARLCELFFA